MRDGAKRDGTRGREPTAIGSHRTGRVQSRPTPPNVACTEPRPAGCALRGEFRGLNAIDARHTVGVPDTIEQVDTDLAGDTESSTRADRPWIVLVWDDPINLMDYVTMVFQKVFGYSREKATQLMMDVHTIGRAVVSNGTREQCEMHVYRLHEFGLWATMQQDD
jgi:ATP-dependent Clp protease adaptor protein ClpS